MSQRAQPLGSGTYRNTDWNTGKRCVQEGKHRNVMSEHGTGTGTRIRTGTGTGTELEIVILRLVLVIPKFERRTKFRESQFPFDSNPIQNKSPARRTLY